MKMPEKSPEWTAIISNSFGEIFDSEKLTTLTEFAGKIDQQEEYVYWDKFKYLGMPEGTSPELAWAYLKFARRSKVTKTNLLCKEGKHFGYWITDNTLRNLSFIDSHTKGQILVSESSVHKSEQKRYLMNSLMEEAIASSQLEGAATTRKKAKEMLRSGRKPRSHAEQMIFNNFQTIIKIKDLIKKPLNDELILKLHRSMTIDTLEDPDWCGRFRTDKDEPIYVKDKDEHILYEPPTADKISGMMEMLYNYVNENGDKKFTHPIIKAINLHFYLSYIHPFNDGNGRTARALFYWYMLNQGYWMFEYLTISRIFIQAPAQYARAFLYTEIDDLDLTYFISFHLRVIKIAINGLIDYIKRKQKEIKDIAYHLKKYPELNNRQKDLIRHALDNPDSQYAISMHQNIHNVTYEAARRDLLYIANKGFLTKTKKGRKFYFVPSDKLHKKIRAHPLQ